MAAFNLGPDPLESTFFIPGSNTPGNGVQLFIYLAGSSTKTTVYMDNAGGAAWSNPIVMDSGGNLPSGGVIWIPSGVTIKAVWAPSNDTDPPTSPYRTIDNIVGINDTDSSSAVSEWITGPTPTFISTTSFSVAGDQTSIFTRYRRVRTTNTAGTIYSTITSVTFGGGITTITVVSDSGTLDSGLSAVAYGIIDPAHPSISIGKNIVIPRTTVTATSFAAITGMTSDVLNTYELVISSFKPVTDNALLQVQLSADGGSTWVSTALYRTEFLQAQNASTFVFGSTHTAGFLSGGTGTSALFPFTGSLTFMNMGDTQVYKVVQFYSGYVGGANLFNDVRGTVFVLVGASSFTAARILPSTGNISTLTYELFGTRRQ